MLFTVGVDVGNSHTKSAHTELISGYTQYEKEQLLADKNLVFNGKYYVESLDAPFPYVEDKTEDGQCLILTLFSIAKEIICRVKESGRCASFQMIQDEIRKYDTLDLAVGLPPGHFSKATKLKEYYQQALSGKITYKYDKYEFSFTTRNIEVYAQGLTAALMNKTLSIPGGASKFYIIDIGGYTVDMIPIINRKPDSDNIRSESMGIIPMCEKIVGHIQTTMGMTLDTRIISDVILENGKGNKITFLDESIKKEILNYCRIYTSQIIDKAIQCGFAVQFNPVLYVGGGSLLLRPFLSANDKVGYAEWVDSSKANAIAYEEYMKMKFKSAA